MDEIEIPLIRRNAAAAAISTIEAEQGVTNLESQSRVLRPLPRRPIGRFAAAVGQSSLGSDPD
jgi:hypothetical protein